MTATTKELCCIREWAPLTDVIERIPARLQKGIFPFPANLNLSCVDALDEFLAIGSDAGIVFWYNRQTGDMQKLRAEVASRITCVKIVNSVEFMVAAGSANGQVSVFQIQKERPPDLDLVAPCTRPKPIQRYTIRELHRSVVSCCEWSKNGMKLYSGDRQGVVVLTEFDYQAHQSKSMEILSEAYEIVQLSVHQSFLLVATLYRCILCQRDSSGQWKITQVGKKDRKQLIDCGAVFLKTQNEPQLICGRPGLRFWVSDVAGNVSKTILFKEAVLRSPTWEIPILNPKQRGAQIVHIPMTSGSREAYSATSNFRELYLFDGQDALLVTHDDATLYILNLDRLRVEAVARGFRKILDFCVCGKEIFVLEGERSLLRLAPMPERPNKTAKVIFNPLMPPPVPILGSSQYECCESPVEPNSAEECFELPPLENINLNVPIELAVELPQAEQSRRLEIFRRIGETDFEQSILHNSASAVSHRKERRGHTERILPSTSSGIVEIGQETHERKIGSETGILPMTNAATLMEASYCQMENNGLPSPVLSPSALQETLAQKIAAELGPLESGEFVLPPQTTVSVATPSTSQLTEPLLKCYPTKLEEVSVQTTPQKHRYCLSDQEEQAKAEEKIDINKSGNYSAGQPVDGIYSASKKEANALKFLPSQPQPVESEEYTSFMPDFRRAGDPFDRRVNNPATSDSNNSSEWEFLDN